MRLYAGKRVKAPVVGNCYVGTSFYISKAVMTVIGVILALPLFLFFKACEFLSDSANILAIGAIIIIIALTIYAAYSAWKNND